MAFYLRKYLKAGPIRLNLSKGGLGLSAGVTGARVGLGPKGAYVHGGRHGMYYRKYMKGNGSKSVSGSGQPDEVNLFIDSGLTFKPLNFSPPGEEPELPSIPNQPLGIRLMGAGSLVCFLVSFFEMLWFVPASLMLTGTLFWSYWHHRGVSMARKLFYALKQGLREKIKVTDLLQIHWDGRLHKTFRPWLDARLFGCFQEAYYEDPDYILPEEMEALEQNLMLPKELIRQIKAHAFGRFTEALLEDHMIDQKEEGLLNRLQKDLRIGDEDIPWEKHLLNQFTRFRNALEQPLKKVATDVHLNDGEACYFSCQGRLLREKVVNRYQRQGVKIRESAYDIDVEGTILLTARRILLLDKGSRSYSIKKILDVTLSLEDHCVLLAVDGRKSPLVLTMDEVFAFAGTLKNLMEASAE